MRGAGLRPAPSGPCQRVLITYAAAVGLFLFVALIASYPRPRGWTLWLPS